MLWAVFLFLIPRTLVALAAMAVSVVIRIPTANTATFAAPLASRIQPRRRRRIVVTGRALMRRTWTGTAWRAMLTWCREALRSTRRRERWKLASGASWKATGWRKGHALREVGRHLTIRWEWWEWHALAARRRDAAGPLVHAEWRRGHPGKTCAC
jgi:hypothetical protein